MNFDFFKPKKQDSRLFIKEHEMYWTPSKSHCQMLLDSNGIKNTTPEFVQELSRFFFHQMLDEDNYINEEFIKNAGDKYQEEIARKVPFYKELFDQYVPGWNPLEKAIFLIQYVQTKQNKNLENELASESTQEAGGKQGEGAPQQAQTGGQGKKKQKAPPDNIDFMLNDIKDNMPGEGEWDNPYMNQLFENKRDLKDFKTKLSFVEKLSLIDTFGKSFEVRKKVTKYRVPNSSKFVQKKMTHFEDILTSPLYQMAFPDYHLKLARKNLISNIPVKPEVQKQKIIFCVDDSGLLRNC